MPIISTFPAASVGWSNVIADDIVTNAKRNRPQHHTRVVSGRLKKIRMPNQKKTYPAVAAILAIKEEKNGGM
jgi:hypothetical protein